MLVRTVFAFTLSAIAALASPNASAVPDRAALKQNCTVDYLALCSEFAPDTPEVQACFKRNRASLSPNCQAAIGGYVKAQKRG